MHLIKDFVTSYHNILFAVAFTWILLNLLVGLVLRLRYPKIPARDILYEEKWQSAQNLSSFWSSLCCYNHCVHIIFLRDRLVLTPHFPLNCFDWWAGLRVSIRYDQIKECARKQFYLQNGVELIYQANEEFKKVRFTAKDPVKVMTYCGNGL